MFPLHFYYLLPSKSPLLLPGGKTRLYSRVNGAPIKNNFLVSASHFLICNIWLDAILKREPVRVSKSPPSPPCDMEALRPVDRSGWEGTNRQQDCGGEKETKSLRTRSHQLGREVETCLNGGVRASVRNKRVVSPPPLHRKTDWDWETEPTLECWARKKTHLREFGICETNLETPDRGSTRAMPFPKSFCKDLFRRFITTTEQQTTISTQPLEEIPEDLVSATAKPGQRLISSVSNVIGWRDTMTFWSHLVTPHLQLCFPWTTNAVPVGVSDDGQSGECAVSPNFQIILSFVFISRGRGPPLLSVHQRPFTN